MGDEIVKSMLTMSSHAASLPEPLEFVDVTECSRVRSFCGHSSSPSFLISAIDSTVDFFTDLNDFDGTTCLQRRPINSTTTALTMAETDTPTATVAIET